MSTIDTYTPEEFASAFARRGYGKKKQAEHWLAENNIAEATEDDFQRCYHAVSARPITMHRSRFTALYLDGQNPVAAEKVKNSSGMSFAAEMAREMWEMDKLESRIKRRKEREQRDSDTG